MSIKIASAKYPTWVLNMHTLPIFWQRPNEYFDSVINLEILSYFDNRKEETHTHSKRTSYYLIALYLSGNLIVGLKKIADLLDTYQ